MRMTEKIKEYQNVIVVALIAFFLGFGASSLFRSDSPREQDTSDTVLNDLNNLMPVSDGKNTDAASDTADAMHDTSVLVKSDAISVEPQRAGGGVRIASVALKDPSWVVVHEDKNGAPGNILGAGWFSAGTHTDIMVELLRGTEPGKKYYVMLHEDGGADKSFDKDTDKALQDPNGNIIMTTFSTTN